MPDTTSGRKCFPELELCQEGLTTLSKTILADLRVALALAILANSSRVALRMSNPIKPTLQSLLVADCIYTDAATGKKIIAGVFNRVLFTPEEKSLHELQAQHSQVMSSGFAAGSPFAYISITDVVGEQELVLRYVDLSDETVLLEGDIRVRSGDRLNTIEMVMAIPPLPSQKPGVFAFELLWQGEPLGTYRLVVSEMPRTDEGSEHGRENDA